jgi:hypothetical protein
MPKPPTKVTPFLAALLIRDLERIHFPDFARLGIKRPDVTLFLDGLSRADAKKLLDWGWQQPALREALGDRSHPNHATVSAFQRVASYFASEHPAQANGSPEAWKEPLAPAVQAYFRGQSNALPVAELSADQARTMIEYVEARPDLKSGYLDGKDARHADLVKEMAALHERAASADIAESGAAAGTGAVDRAAIQPRVNELLGDEQFMKAYSDKHHPMHADAVQRMLQAHEGGNPSPPSGPAHSSPTRGGSGSGAAAAASPARKSAAELTAHPAYRDGSHPQHADIVRQVGDALEGFC